MKLFSVYDVWVAVPLKQELWVWVKCIYLETECHVVLVFTLTALVDLCFFFFFPFFAYWTAIVSHRLFFKASFKGNIDPF